MHVYTYIHTHTHTHTHTYIYIYIYIYICMYVCIQCSLCWLIILQFDITDLYICFLRNIQILITFRMIYCSLIFWFICRWVNFHQLPLHQISKFFQTKRYVFSLLQYTLSAPQKKLTLGLVLSPTKYFFYDVLYHFFIIPFLFNKLPQD